jgi:hypothetical protein
MNLPIKSALPATNNLRHYNIDTKHKSESKGGDNDQKSIRTGVGPNFIKD